MKIYDTNLDEIRNITQVDLDIIQTLATGYWRLLEITEGPKAQQIQEKVREQLNAIKEGRSYKNKIEFAEYLNER